MKTYSNTLHKFFLSCITLTVCVSGIAASGFNRNYERGLIRNGTQCLDAKDNKLSMKACSQVSASQKWNASGAGQLRYTLSDGHLSDDCLDVPTESRGKSSSRVQMWSCNESKSMTWQFVPVSAASSTFRIQSNVASASPLCLQAALNAAMVTTCTAATQGPQVFQLSFTTAQFAALNISRPNWMRDIYESKPNVDIRSVIIPGTHDSATYKDFSAISTTQSRTIFQQLMSGIRYVDLRIGDKNNIVHGIEKGNADTLNPVMMDIQKFAKAHPKEIVFVDMHETPDDANALRSLKVTIDKYLTPHLIPVQQEAKLTFEELWSRQPGKNIVLLIRKSAEFNTATKGALKNAVWSKKISNPSAKSFTASGPFWGEVWPDSTTFSEIHRKNNAGLQLRPKTKWHMSQLLRTPRVGDAILATFGIKGSPHRLATEKTSEGVFNLQLGKWVADWSKKDNFTVNFVATDFYELTTVIETAIVLNHANNK